MSRLKTNTPGKALMSQTVCCNVELDEERSHRLQHGGGIDSLALSLILHI